MFALYVPKPEEIVFPLIALTIVMLVLCGYSVRLGLPFLKSAAAIICGGFLACSPNLFKILNEDLGGYGDMAREWSSTKYSDSFFALTSYLHVGPGALTAGAGMLAGLTAFGLGHHFGIRRRNSCGEDTKPTAAT